MHRIPRPETAELCQWIVETQNENWEKEVVKTNYIRFLYEISDKDSIDWSDNFVEGITSAAADALYTCRVCRTRCSRVCQP